MKYVKYQDTYQECGHCGIVCREGDPTMHDSETCVECLDTLMDNEICGACAGSGEGMYSGSICKKCKGGGEVMSDYAIERMEAMSKYISNEAMRAFKPKTAEQLQQERNKAADALYDVSLPSGYPKAKNNYKRAAKAHEIALMRERDHE